MRCLSSGGGLLLAFAFACSSESLNSGEEASAGRDGRGAAAGGGGDADGVGGDAGDAGGEAEMAGQGGEAYGGAAGAASGQAGSGGADASPGYRLSGEASAMFDSAGGAGGDMARGGAASNGGGEAGAGGAVELPHIDRVECSFLVDILDVLEDGDGGFSATAVGEVFRNVYVGERRYEFSAFVAGPATLSATSGGAVELRAVGDQTGAKPFWRELELLSGEASAGGSYEGAWSCASLELEDPGFPDTEGVAPGTWRLEPM